MNKIITLSFALCCLIFSASCTTDIEVNSPALQATKSGELIRTFSKKAIVYDNGTLEIQGIVGDEAINFTIAEMNTGKYKIGDNNINIASYKNSIGKFISENDITDGEVVITSISNNEVSGEFYFRNLKDINGNRVDLMNGWFYRVPLENYSPEITINVEEDNPCLLNASFTALVDGETLITDDHNARIIGAENASVIIEGLNENEEIAIVFPIDVQPGTYSFVGNGEFSATYGPLGSKSSALSGTLTITQHNQEDKCITGTFEFTTRSGYTITEGNFDFGY
ncbi:DUF6252 family protein [Aquimarina brevivitae]|uniref:DUF4382 domain-containing protein n=1 Tax=Aquimarina brevivitae TaxID=323412 RepID=A0A4Q7PH72_9FLAO|nr:DUF6252 family protein [Aquimarina brevivitae]RZS99745.1 hypothetical protein EV197_0971 [Aquimarina brevivitae]